MARFRKVEVVGSTLDSCLDDREDNLAGVVQREEEEGIVDSLDSIQEEVVFIADSKKRS